MDQPTPRPVVIDTDPGLDDGVAILFALACPEFEVLGLTTVAGNLGLAVTTRNALRLLHRAGRDDIPVLAGAAGPLSGEAISVPQVHGGDGLGGVALADAPRGPLAGDAVTWLGDVLDSRPPGSVDVLALGPLTNLARLVAERPAAARRIRRIVAMGGAVRERGNVGGRAEFNMAADPEAARIVLGSGLPLALVPLDLTRQVRADRAWTATLASSGGPAARTAASLVGAYFDGTAGEAALRESRPLHDPCVMLYALSPHLFRVERLAIRVETQGPDAGATLLADDGSPIDLVLGVDAPAALALLASRLARF